MSFKQHSAGAIRVLTTMLCALLCAACAGPAAVVPSPTVAPPTPSEEPPLLGSPVVVTPINPTAMPSPAVSPPATTVPAATATPSFAAARLPAPVYFIAADSGQIVRLEPDGQTLSQLTFESQPVLEFDVAAQTGALVYVIGDPELETREWTLLTLDGSGRRELVYGEISQARIRPNGQLVVFRLDNPPPGLLLGQEQSPAGVYSSVLTGGRPGLVRADLPPDGDPGNEAVSWVYSPVDWSPDGSRLALYGYDADLAGIPGGQVFIIDPANPDGAAVSGPSCCEQERWSADGNYLTVGGGGPGPDLRYGLYRVNASTGEEEEILGYLEDRVPFVSAPQQLADGQIYAFVELAPVEEASWEYPYRPALSRVALDGTVTPLRPADLPPGEVLWRADASGVLVSMFNGARPDGLLSGQLVWLPLDGDDAVLLPVRGGAMRWAPTAPLANGDCGRFTSISYEAAGVRTVRAEVRDLQERLIAQNYGTGGVDGLYGDFTREAVKALQSERGLPETGDVDCATWQALLAGR